MKNQFVKARFGLVLLGIGLGWLARIILGEPAEDLGPPRTIDRPLEKSYESLIDLPILKNETDGEAPVDSRLAPPIDAARSFDI